MIAPPSIEHMKILQLGMAVASAFELAAYSQPAAETDAGLIERYLAVEKKAKEAYVQSLSDVELLALANEAGWHRDARRILPSIWWYGLAPRWHQNPLAPEKHLSLIRDAKLSPLWRIGLITTLDRYTTAWSIQQFESAVTEALWFLEREDLDGRDRAAIAGSLDRIIFAKWKFIDDEARLSLLEKRSLVDQLHALNKVTIATLVTRLSRETDEDDFLLRSYAMTLRSIGSVYLTQNRSFTSRYSEGVAFAGAAQTAQTIRQAFRMVLNSGNYPPQTVLEIVQDMAELDWKLDIPKNLVEIYKQNPKFTTADLDTLAGMIQRIHRPAPSIDSGDQTDTEAE
jgi:hypothetical protein